MDPKYLMMKALIDKTTGSVSKQSIMSESLEDSIPAFVQDSYHFIDIVYSIRNAAFNIPRCMTYGRYRYMVQQLAAKYQSPDILGLDPAVQELGSDRNEMIQNVTWDLIAPLENSLIFCVKSSTTEILSVPSYGDGNTQFTDIAICIPHSSGRLFRITFRQYTVLAVEGENSREAFLRLKAAESDTVPIRSMFMLSDLMFPLDIIPGFSTRQQLTVASREADRFEYEWDWVSPPL